MVFNVGASTGGTDIVAMILHKYTSLEIGRALLVSDLGNRADRRLPLRCTDRTLLYPGNDLEMYRCRQCH